MALHRLHVRVRDSLDDRLDHFPVLGTGIVIDSIEHVEIVLHQAVEPSDSFRKSVLVDEVLPHHRDERSLRLQKCQRTSSH